MVMNKFNIKDESFLNLYTTSIAPIINENYLIKKTPITKMPKEGYVIRVTYRKANSKEKDFSEYYNAELVKIGELKH